VDQERSSLDLNEALKEVITLCERFARLREVRIESSFPDLSTAMEGKAFDLMHLIYRCVAIPLAAAKRGSALHVSSQAIEQGARIVVTGEGELEEIPELQSQKHVLAVLVEAVGGTLELTSEPVPGTRVVIELPRVLLKDSPGVGDATD
jgi:hypothetical protein